jgi:radical SAM superfamily enzyme YgiQ (UPF0313 family)
MKISIFNPPTPNTKKVTREGRCSQEQGVWGTLWPPLSLAYLAAVLEADGHQVDLHDFPAIGENQLELGAQMRRFAPDLAIWSTATQTIVDDLDIASILKTVDPAIKTAVFGTHVTCLDRECLSQHADLDFIIRGEPELTAKALARALQNGRSCEEIQGLSFRDAQGRICINENRPFIDDLDALPTPAWHLLDLQPYRLPLLGRRFLMILPTRGCPFSCTFCTTHSYYGSRLRKRSIQSIIAEMQRNISEFGIRDFFFWSDTFTIDKRYVNDLCQAIVDEGLDIAWTCNSRVDTTDRHTFSLMKKAGCWMVSFGAESGCQRVLDAVGKHITPEQTRQAVKLAKKSGLKVAGHFILGLPGDNSATIGDTIRFSNALGLDFVQYYSSVPFPGSQLFNQALEKGWISGAEIDWSDFRQDKSSMHLPGLRPDEADRFRGEAYRTFYNNPMNLISKLRLLRPAGVVGLLRSAKTFVNWL